MGPALAHQSLAVKGKLGAIPAHAHFDTAIITFVFVSSGTAKEFTEHHWGGMCPGMGFI